MKNFVTCVIIFLSLQLNDRPLTSTTPGNNIIPAGNLFIITLDGFRWQEIFTGADPVLINNEKYTPDTATMKMLYWSPDAEGRRKKLLPFFWNVIAAKGQLYGNRFYDNKVNNSNIYSISYPGYNEIFTGNTDISISSNHKYSNPNINILEWLNQQGSFKGKVAAFTSWDVFPYIFNEKRSQVVLNSGYEDREENGDPGQSLINKVQDDFIHDRTATRHDLLTFLTAKEYIQLHQPRVISLGLGETDEAAHNARYDIYLEKAAEADKMIAELWHWVQTTPGYKDNTTFIITTDHGRGKYAASWPDHGMFIRGSSQTWLALIGPTIKPAGEMKEDQQLYQKQLAQTIASLLGKEFKSSRPIATAVSLK
ncbi:MAG: alkaline phosphatase family protein [Bacteroidota bacterium]|nr:alkaline phosphatase family protein [Bacteroidota bacterium]